MGYFSQRKKNERENIILKTLLVFLSLLAVFILFVQKESGVLYSLGNLRFQFFIVSFFVLVYSLYHKRIYYAFYSFVLLLLYYGFVSSHTNLFFNSEINPKNKLEMIFSKNYESDLISKDFELQRSGYVNLSEQRKAYFSTVAKAQSVYTILSLNLTYLENSEIEKVYANMAEFVLQRDEPVIIVGNFGIPAWHPVFKSFLSETSLRVKNKILLRDNQGSFNPFIVPRVNVLGFDNVGIEKVMFLPNSRNLLKLKLDLRSISLISFLLCLRLRRFWRILWHFLFELFLLLCVRVFLPSKRYLHNHRRLLLVCHLAVLYLKIAQKALWLFASLCGVYI